jgi:hypothetical protein
MAGEPREFGPYRLVRRLGVGGMAETFEATRLGAGGFEQRVCLKRVLPAFSEDKEFVCRFQREARLAAQLRHTNIVGVIDVGEINGAHFMALELVDGVDLRSFLKSSPGEKLRPDTVALIGLDLAYALKHAHDTLVHRDISPSNILLSRAGEAKLADFGIAKAIENAKVTESRSAKGKVPYMAPEHMRGETVDGRADVFSLGVVMFEALAGVRPFDGAHDVETMQKILDGDRLSLDDAAPGVPAPLRDIIERSIEVDPSARPQSASELLEGLAAVAPSPSVRRELAAAVEAQRGGPHARLHVRARDEERDTELTRLPETAPAKTRQPPKRGRAWLALFLVLLLAAGTAARVMTSTSTDTDTITDTDTKTDTDKITDAITIANEIASETDIASETEIANETETANEDAPSPPARAAKGWVNVVVQPWGNVWIDGDYMGRAPVTARLAKGRHVVEAGRELRSQRRVVRVQPGARKEIELTLGDD